LSSQKDILGSLELSLDEQKTINKELHVIHEAEVSKYVNELEEFVNNSKKDDEVKQSAKILELQQSLDQEKDRGLLQQQLLKLEVARTNTELVLVKEDLRMLQTTSTLMEFERDDLKNKLADFDYVHHQNLEKLILQNEEMRKQKTEFEQLEAKLTKADKLLVELRIENAGIRSEINSLKATSKQSANSLEDSQRSNQERILVLEKKCSELQSEKAMLSQINEDCEKTIKELKSSSKRNLDDVSSVRDKISALDAKLVETQKLYRDSASKVKELEIQIRKLEIENGSLKSQNELFRQQSESSLEKLGETLKMIENETSNLSKVGSDTIQKTIETARSGHEQFQKQLQQTLEEERQKSLAQVSTI
jgi:chromosome segregation ATPase